MSIVRSIVGVVASAVTSAAFFVASAGSAEAGILEDIKSRGQLVCIVSTGLTGFSYKDSAGRWAGFDVDFCRGVAAAIFDNGDDVRLVPASTKNRFTLLTSGEGDMLSRNTTWSLARDADLGVDFPATTYYDGQGFIVPKSLGVSDATQLDGASVCVQSGTTTELNLADFFRSNSISYESVSIETNEEALVAYSAGRCDAYTTDASGLAASRASLPNPSDHLILPNIISKEPLAVAVREGDAAWADVVRWVVFGIIEAEELGISSSNVDELVRNGGNNNPSIRRLLGLEGSLGSYLGLGNDFMVRVLKSVGNYGEIFDRNLSPLGLSRGVNAQWTDGGVLYAPPLR